MFWLDSPTGWTLTLVVIDVPLATVFRDARVIRSYLHHLTCLSLLSVHRYSYHEVVTDQTVRPVKGDSPELSSDRGRLLQAR